MTIAPVGTIVAYAGKTAPAGWLMCDATPIPHDAAHSTLRNLVGPNTPDLRGYFLRGLDPRKTTDAHVDPDAPRALFSPQQDAIGPHTHVYDHWFHNDNQGGKSGGSHPDVAGSHDQGGTGGPNPGASETRPKNIAVNFIIKATAEG